MVHLAPDFKIQPLKIIQACSILWHSLAFAWFTGKLCLQNCKYRSLTPQPSLSALSSKLPMDSLLSSDFSRWHKLHGTETKLSGFLKALLFGWRWGGGWNKQALFSLHSCGRRRKNAQHSRKLYPRHFHSPILFDQFCHIIPWRHVRIEDC